MKRFFSVKRIIMAVFIGILFYVVYRFVSCKYMDVETQMAQKGEVKDFIQTTGIAVRDEVILNNNSYNKDNLKYLFSDGEKVSKNAVLAEVYKSSDDAKTSYKIDSIDKEIEVLERLNLSKYNISRGINFINNQINEEIKNLLISQDDVKLLESEDYKQKILYLLNEKQIVLGKDINLDERIEALEEEKNQLLSSYSKNTAVINSPESGDFISHADGCENIIDYKTITHSNFENLNLDDISGNISNESKIIKSETWYLVCKITGDEYSKVSVGEEVKVNILSLDFASDIPCRIESIVKKSESDDFIMVLSCENMNKNLASIRKEEIRIDLREYSGIKINRNSIHNYSEDNNNFETGVYVKSGSYLKFRKVKPIFWGTTDIICSYTSEEDADINYIHPGDNVVVGGTDLYVGKRVK